MPIIDENDDLSATQNSPNLKVPSEIFGNKIKCCICHRICSKNPKYIQLEVLSDVILPFVLCSKCQDTFTAEDIKLMTNLFMIFGGYFAKNKLEPFSPLRILHELTSNTAHLEPTQINMQLLHRALLHGISPKEYVEKLQQLASSELNSFF